MNEGWQCFMFGMGNTFFTQNLYSQVGNKMKSIIINLDTKYF